tara:strand:- start:30897 stop:31196 length:300 start_codon:yes stop_codon:yes gene_type:complete
MNQQFIEEAIRSKSIVEFSYGNHRRVVEPHVVGVINGAVQMLGYQIGGSSSSGGIPEWRRFDLNRINGLSSTGQNFAGRRPFPSGQHSPWDYEILVVDP